jgi:Domain of unknown function (DUF4375)
LNSFELEQLSKNFTRKFTHFATSGLLDPAESLRSQMAIDSRAMNRRLIKLSESPGSRFWRLDYQELSAPERVFLLIWELESEVNNGRFQQYFHNSSGAHAPEIVAALNTIGAPATAHIAQRALDAVTGTVTNWRDDTDRQASVARRSPQARQTLEELDREYYKCPEDLTPLLYNYVTEHRAEVRAPSDF